MDEANQATQEPVRNPACVHSPLRIRHKRNAHALRTARHRKAEQNLVEQMSSAFWKRDAQQDRPVILRSRLGYKADTLRHFFGLINNRAKGGF